MARHTNGYVKLYRSTEKGDITDKPLLLALWSWLLMAATWQPTSKLWNGKRRDLPPGTVIMGLRELSSRWEVSPNTIKRWLKYLIESERIQVESCTAGTIITIRNWNEYQGREEEGETPPAQELHADCTPPARDLHATCTRPAPYEEVQEGKKVRKKESKNTTAQAFAEGPSPTAQVWRAYREAFEKRYRTEPTWNLKTGGMLKNFVSRVPVHDAPEIAAFYLTHNDAQYVNSRHAVSLLLRDAEKIHTDWKTGQCSTQTEARRIDRKQANFNAWGPLIAEAQRREGESA